MVSRNGKLKSTRAIELREKKSQQSGKTTCLTNWGGDRRKKEGELPERRKIRGKGVRGGTAANLKKTRTTEKNNMNLQQQSSLRVKPTTSILPSREREGTETAESEKTKRDKRSKEEVEHADKIFMARKIYWKALCAYTQRKIHFPSEKRHSKTQKRPRGTGNYVNCHPVKKNY